MNTLKSQKKKKKGYKTEKSLNMESDQPEIKVIAPLHEIPPPPTTENIMKTLNNDKEPDENKMVTETDFGKDERDEAGPPGKADMEAPKGTGNTIMNDTPDVVSRYENKLDDEIIEDQNLISRKLERRKHLSGNLSISSDLHLELYLQWEQALDSPDFQSQTPLQDLNKDMEISVSLIGLEIIWVFKGGGIGTWWIGTLL